MSVIVLYLPSFQFSLFLLDCVLLLCAEIINALYLAGMIKAVEDEVETLKKFKLLVEFY